METEELDNQNDFYTLNLKIDKKKFRKVLLVGGAAVGFVSAVGYLVRQSSKDSFVVNADNVEIVEEVIIEAHEDTEEK